MTQEKYELLAMPTTLVVVVDTNLLVRALIGGPDSSPALEAWKSG